MTVRPPPTVVLLSAPGTLDAIDPRLRRAGVRLVRLSSLVTRPIAGSRWLSRVTGIARPDTVVVTSRAAVEAGVVPWRRAIGSVPRYVEFWAAGPGTAQTLRRAGVRKVHRPPAVGGQAVARSLGRRPRRTIVYFRSNLAGTGLARALRDQGHRVADVVVYRVETPSRMSGAARRLLASADLVIATSPSALSSLRRRWGSRSFSRFARTARLVVLGERSRRAARGHGFRHTSVAPSPTAQRFTGHLLRELRDART
jgi:uroporphyrinogen-III synthase